MGDARAPLRATMPVQIGPCRGGDFISRSQGPAKRVGRDRHLVELASSVRFSSWAETPGFWVHSVVSVGKLWKTFLGVPDVGSCRLAHGQHTGIDNA